MEGFRKGPGYERVHHQRRADCGTLTGPPDSLVYAVVGFDGSASSLRALDPAARLLNDRPGGMEIAYIPHLSALITGGDVGGLASAEVQQSFNDATRELSDEVRAPAGRPPDRCRATLALPAPRRRDRRPAHRGGGRPAPQARDRGRGGHHRRATRARIPPRPRLDPAGPGAARSLPRDRDRIAAQLAQA